MDTVHLGLTDECQYVTRISIVTQTLDNLQEKSVLTTMFRRKQKVFKTYSHDFFFLKGAFIF